MPRGSKIGSHPVVSAGVQRASIHRQSGVADRRLKVFLLGQFRVETAGGALEVPGKKAQALLAYLAMPPGRRHAREQLAGLLSGGMED